MRDGTVCASKRVSFANATRSLPRAGLYRFQPKHEHKATGHLAQGLPLALAVTIGRVADAAAKQRAEGSETLKTYLETHLRHAEPLGTKQLFGLLNSSLDQVQIGRASCRERV